MTLGHEKLDVMEELDRVVAVLSQPRGRACQVREDQTIYGDQRYDFDPDFDSDLDQDAK